MTNVLDMLTEYLGSKMELTPGDNIFYNSMPDGPIDCVALTEPKLSYPVPPQVNAETHHIQITARGATSAIAFELAADCYRWLSSSSDVYVPGETELTGFIEVDGLTIYSQPHGTPRWSKTDQQQRRYYEFTATVITKKLI